MSRQLKAELNIPPPLRWIELPRRSCVELGRTGQPRVGDLQVHSIPWFSSLDSKGSALCFVEGAIPWFLQGGCRSPARDVRRDECRLYLDCTLPWILQSAGILGILTGSGLTEAQTLWQTLDFWAGAKAGIWKLRNASHILIPPGGFGLLFSLN